MSKIKTTCPVCGDLTLEPHAITLQVSNVIDLNTYSFKCPRCLQDICKPADMEVRALLTGTGVIVVRLIVPLEAMELHTGPTICMDDVLDFTYALAQSNILTERL